jgi:hypothetical protein
MVDHTATSLIDTVSADLAERARLKSFKGKRLEQRGT